LYQLPYPLLSPKVFLALVVSFQQS